MALGFANERGRSACDRKQGLAKRDAVAWAIDEVSEELGGLRGKVSGSPVQSRRVDLQPRSKRDTPFSDTVGLSHKPFLDEMRHVLAGTLARTLAQAFVHPVDTVKTRLQVRSPPEAVKKWKKSIKKHPFELHIKQRRVMKMRNWLYKGPRDLYLGLTGAVLGTLPVGLLYFAAYETCKSYMEKRGLSDSPVTHLTSASAGAIVSSLVRVPTDTIRHRVQAYLHNNIFEAAVYIVKHEGVRGLYAGLGPTIARDVPEIAIQFALYERLRKQLAADRENQKLHTWEHLVLGGLSGALAAIATMPFDVAKTTMQCGTRRLPLLQSLAMTVEEKGVKGLYAGLYPRVTQVALMSAVFFTMFEFCKMQLKPTSLRDPHDQLLAPKIYKKKRDKVWKRQFVVE